MIHIKSIDPKLLGQRLAEARKARGVTQGETAEYLGCSRPTLIGVEKGSRPAKPAEIIRLASFYGRNVHDFVRPGAPMADLQPHLRAVAEKMKADDRELLQGIAELQQFVDDYRELEDLMSAPLKSNYPAAVSLNPRIDVVAFAENVAVGERQRLGLGDQPIHHLRSVLETDVGLRILYGNLPSAVAGMFAFVADFGCCIMVNRKHPPERRRASLVHEYGHLFVDRFKPGIDYLNVKGRKPASERFAEAFAMSFLMPASSVRRRLNDIVDSTGDFQVADLCRMSHMYFVSLEAMALRLERLRLIPKGSRDHLKESGFEVRRASQMLDLPTDHDTNDLLPERYQFLAINALEQAKITEGQLARFLRCDPVTARGMVAEFLTLSGESDEGEPQVRRLMDSQLSLLPNV